MDDLQTPIPNSAENYVQREINQTKNEIKILKDKIIKTHDLTIEAKLALLQTAPSKLEIPKTTPIKVSNIDKPSTITFQKI